MSLATDVIKSLHSFSGSILLHLRHSTTVPNVLLANTAIFRYLDPMVKDIFSVENASLERTLQTMVASKRHTRHGMGVTNWTLKVQSTTTDFFQNSRSIHPRKCFSSSSLVRGAPKNDPAN